jgi:hypothetical protein
MGTIQYQNVLHDLLLPIEEQDFNYVPPYSDGSTLDEKFNATIRSLFQAKRLQNRSLQLLYAYYLGQILEEQTNPIVKRTYYAQQLTSYYRITAVRVYYLFKPFGPMKVMNSTRTSLTIIRKLKTEEFQDLVLRSSLIFNGVENWEGSDVTGGYCNCGSRD